MPLIGWLLGMQFERYITGVDHWIAFLLLLLIGGKMLRDAFHSEEGPGDGDDRLDLRELVLLAVATSIDALAVGITFAFLQVSILPSVAMIGITTLSLSFLGVALGNQFGMKYESKRRWPGGWY